MRGSTISAGGSSARPTTGCGTKAALRRVRLPGAERPTGGAHHLEAAQNALPIAGLEAAGQGRVETRQLGVEIGSGRAVPPQLVAQCCRDVGDRRQAFEQRLEVEAGAAGDESEPPARLDLAEQRPALASQSATEAGSWASRMP